MFTGCVSSGTQVKESDLGQFRKGQTTQQDVEKALGTPQGRMSDSDGARSISYVYSHAHAKGASYIPVVGIFAGGAKGQTNIVTFKFDSQGKLLDYTASSADVDTRMGH
jgi:outer membrane protein assembly factor BamE (lipoprotein component of BamABCDE complex)